MEQVLSLRAFVPAADYGASKAFYQALGFRLTQDGPQVALLKLGSFGFILQNRADPAVAENLMMHLLVRDVTAWWRDAETDALAARFGTKPPRAPAMQEWGLVVGFVFDPSGVLWHIAEAPF